MKFYDFAIMIVCTFSLKEGILACLPTILKKPQIGRNWPTNEQSLVIE